MSVLVPEAAVTVGGKDIETVLSGTISKVSVTLAMNEESWALVELADGYDLKARRLKAVLSDNLKPGNKVEVQLGYAGDRAAVFCGYLERIELEAESDKAHILRLYACDVVHLMKENRFCRMIMEKSHSAVLKKLISTYNWLGIRLDCDPTREYEQARTWYQNETDFQFLNRELLDQCPDDRDLYVSLGTVYYKAPDSSKAVVSLEPAGGILSCHGVSCYVKRKIMTYGLSASFQSFAGTGECAADYLAGAAGTAIRQIPVPDGHSREFMNGIAAAQAARDKRKAVGLKIRMKGNTQLLTGSYVKMDKLDPVWNGVYRIRRAEHSLDEDGYQTYIVLEGC